jgi:hypothetical protein
MSENTLFDGLDNVANAGRFFVALTERLGDGTLTAGEDAARIAQALVVPLPPELADFSIVALEESKADEPETARAQLAQTRIVITYPEVPYPGSGQVERTFSRCFQACTTVKGAKVCVKVCVKINIGLSGIGGAISATVSVAF